MDYDIRAYLLKLISEVQSVDIAISEFKKQLKEDEELKAAYSEWCEEEGYSERSGYADFIEEYIDVGNERWENSINEYDDE